MNQFDVVVIGAGAAGMMCAAQAGQKGCKVLLIDHSEKVAEKIRISGGGRCNFTNKVVEWQHFVSDNPRFAKHALSQYQPGDFIRLLKQHGLSYTEKHKGQLFCDQKSQAIISMLTEECQMGQVVIWRPCLVESILKSDTGFDLHTSRGLVKAKNLVIATGGLPVPKIGATDFGLRVAKQFNHKLVDTAPALVPLFVKPEQWALFSALSGVSLSGNVTITGKSVSFEDDVLLTHRGLSGPAILQLSTYWRPGEELCISLSGYTNQEVWQQSLKNKMIGSKATFLTAVSELLPNWPKRFTSVMFQNNNLEALAERKAAEIGKQALNNIGANFYQWRVRPSSTAGYAKAEVMRGGVSTANLCSKTMQSKLVDGLYFIGEVVDVTGWLGGYNFQWAWASGMLAAKSVANKNNWLD